MEMPLTIRYAYHQQDGPIVLFTWESAEGKNTAAATPWQARDIARALVQAADKAEHLAIEQGGRRN